MPPASLQQVPAEAQRHPPHNWMLLLGLALKKLDRLVQPWEKMHYLVSVIAAIISVLTAGEAWISWYKGVNGGK